MLIIINKKPLNIVILILVIEVIINLDWGMSYSLSYKAEISINLKILEPNTIASLEDPKNIKLLMQYCQIYLSKIAARWAAVLIIFGAENTWTKCALRHPEARSENGQGNAALERSLLYNSLPRHGRVSTWRQ